TRLSHFSVLKGWSWNYTLPLHAARGKNSHAPRRRGNAAKQHRSTVRALARAPFRIVKIRRALDWFRQHSDWSVWTRLHAIGVRARTATPIAPGWLAAGSSQQAS